MDFKQQLAGMVADAKALVPALAVIGDSIPRKAPRTMVGSTCGGSFLQAVRSRSDMFDFDDTKYVYSSSNSFESEEDFTRADFVLVVTEWKLIEFKRGDQVSIIDLYEMKPMVFSLNGTVLQGRIQLQLSQETAEVPASAVATTPDIDQKSDVKAENEHKNQFDLENNQTPNHNGKETDKVVFWTPAFCDKEAALFWLNCVRSKVAETTYGCCHTWCGECVHMAGRCMQAILCLCNCFCIAIR